MRHSTNNSNSRSFPGALQIGTMALVVALATLGLFEAYADGIVAEPDDVLLRVSDGSQVISDMESKAEPRRSSRRRRPRKPSTPSETGAEANTRTVQVEAESQSTQTAEQPNELPQRTLVSARRDSKESSELSSEPSLSATKMREPERVADNNSGSDVDTIDDVVSKPLPLRADARWSLSEDELVSGSDTGPPTNRLRNSLGTPQDQSPLAENPHDIDLLDKTETERAAETEPEQFLAHPDEADPHQFDSARHTIWLFALLGITPDGPRELLPSAQLSERPIPETPHAIQEIWSADAPNELAEHPLVEDSFAAHSQAEPRRGVAIVGPEMPAELANKFGTSMDDALLPIEEQSESHSEADGGHDSHEDPSGNEFVIFDECQVLPCYKVTLSQQRQN